MQSSEIEVSCFGYSQTVFSTHRPDRLCRGREYWIYQPEEVEEEVVFRTVISGTTILDQEIRHLSRGIRCSGHSLGDIVSVLFSQKIVGWVEEGDPNFIPSSACGVELYRMSRPNAKVNKWCARYEIKIDADELDDLVELGMDAWVVNPNKRAKTEPVPENRPYPAIIDEELNHPVLCEELRNAMFWLTGHRNPQNKHACFQPVAIPEVLKYCDALVLLHKDKHDVCLGIYTLDAEFEFSIDEIQEKLSSLVIPFSIPPMLARWDRALKEFYLEKHIEELSFLNTEDSEESEEDE
ncbi:MAG: hypothetical protein CL916_05860 [Deltaproteobacteria bacterium]|nr:hypothetical protein [Deltaproteobacteria bacterium]